MGSSQQRRWSRKDLLLLLLYSPGASDEINEPIRGRTRLVKMVFLFRQELYREFKFDRVVPEQVLPDFRPWYYGPFSADVLYDIDFLEALGFLEVKRQTDAESLPEEEAEYYEWISEEALTYDQPEEAALPYIPEEFSLSEKGVQFVEAKGLYSQLTPNQQAVLKRFKSRIVTAPLRALLLYVYEKYPGFAERSRIAGELR